MGLENKIGFVGAGSMAQAIAEGLIASGTVDASNIAASATSGRFQKWWEERSIKFWTDNNEVIENSDVVFISVKPHLYIVMFDRLSDERRRYGDKLWISILAGVVLSDLDFAVNKVTKEPALRIVRSMPNTPVKVRKGRVAVTLSEGCSSQDRNVVSTLFSAVGRCVEVPERLQNSFAGMAGSGPAYIYQIIEALADGGVMMGLPRDLAQEHAAAMVEGAAGMVLSQGKHPGHLKDEVCSPAPSGGSRCWRVEESGLPSWGQSRLQQKEM